jgi:hypothetical protein
VGVTPRVGFAHCLLVEACGREFACFVGGLGIAAMAHLFTAKRAARWSSN